jgi:hypothetical protein
MSRNAGKQAGRLSAEQGKNQGDSSLTNLMKVHALLYLEQLGSRVILVVR